MYCNFKTPCTTYYGNRHDIRSPQSHLALIAPMTRRPLQALFQRSVLGQSGGIGVEDVEHPWIERLHDAQRVGRDCFIVLPRSNWLIPANIGLKECMTMTCMHKASTVSYTDLSTDHFDFPINFLSLCGEKGCQSRRYLKS